MNENESEKMSDADAEALDYLVESGFDAAAVERMPERLRARARGLLATTKRLEEFRPAPPSDTLVDATLARIDQAERQQRERMRLERVSSRRWNLPNVVAVAAVVLVAVGIVYPVANEVRSSSSQAMCASGLRTLGNGIASYASDHAGALPAMASLAPILPGQSSDGAILDNARHLEMLARQGYCDSGCTKCNGARSLSYRVPLHDRHVTLAGLPRSPIAGDANPVQPLAARSGGVSNADMRSVNHGQRGQNLLYSDGSTGWTISPVIRVDRSGREDNIWVIRGRDGRPTLDFKMRSGDAWDILLAN